MDTTHKLCEEIKQTSTLEIPQNVKNEYDDDNIPEIDTKNVISDEVPRRDGPGGE